MAYKAYPWIRGAGLVLLALSLVEGPALLALPALSEVEGSEVEGSAVEGSAVEGRQREGSRTAPAISSSPV